MVRVRLNQKQARRYQENLRRLERNCGDLEPFFRQAGAYMVNSTVKNFSRQKSPAGDKWAPLKPSTLEARSRGRRTRSGKRILQVTGALKNSVGVMEIDKKGVMVGPIGGVEQLKARTHQFGREQKSKSLPFGGRPIPARPFLGFTKRDADYVTDGLADEVMEGLANG